MLNKLYSLLLQLPIGTPSPDNNNPIDFTKAFNVIVYIVMPILVIIFYILWRRKKRDGD